MNDELLKMLATVGVNAACTIGAAALATHLLGKRAEKLKREDDLYQQRFALFQKLWTVRALETQLPDIVDCWNSIPLLFRDEKCVSVMNAWRNWYSRVCTPAIEDEWRTEFRKRKLAVLWEIALVLNIKDITHEILEGAWLPKGDPRLFVSTSKSPL